jgi:adenylate cyclase
MAVMDFAHAGLLDGLEGEQRAARRELLAQLADDGVTLDELRAAVAEHRLALLPVERVLGGSYTAREIEQRAGLSVGLMLRIRRLSGLPGAGPDDRLFGDEEIAAAQSTKLFPVLVASFKAHLRESVRRGMLGRAELEAGQIAEAQEVAICFADLVGFTRLGGEVEVEELGTAAGRLADLAAQVTVAPVRLVKTIGDAAMFVSPDPGAVVAVALSLVEAVEQAGLPSLRAGVALGPALQRAGDFYGHTVNLASRVTGIARGGSVLCTAEVHDAAREDFDWSFAKRHQLKGVAEPVSLYRARCLESSAP